MKLKNFICILAIPFLVSCGSSGASGGGGGGGGSFDYDPPTIDVDSIAVPQLKRDTLTGEIKEDDTKVYFDFYEVSDYHGAVNYSTDEKTIGLAKMADYFSKKRAENPGGTVVVSSGDMFQGSAESNLTRGYYVNYGMNIMGYEAMALGNHEFDWGLDWLRKNHACSIENYSIPYLGANVFDKSTGKILDFLQASIVIERGDYKIGVIGTLGDGANLSIMPSLVEGLEFKQEAPIVKEEAKRLKEEVGCDIVVWTSHRGAEELVQSGVTKADGVDIAFGGHTHENSPAEGQSAISTSDGLKFLQTKNYGRGIAHAQLSIDKTTKEVNAEIAEVDTKPYEYPGLVDHAEVKKVCDAYNQYIDPIKSQVIGSVDAELDISETYSLTNYCVDTMQLVAKHFASENGGYDVVAAFHNANGGVRAKLPAGDITYSSIYKSFPFDNEIVLVKASAKKMRSYMSKSRSYGVWHDLKIKDLNSYFVDGDYYYFATTDFMATSKSFAFELSEADLIRTGYIVRDAIAGRILNQKAIKKSKFTRSSNPQFDPVTN